MEDCSGSGSTSTVSEDDNLVVSSEGSSCPDETELELGLGLSIGLKGKKDSRVSYAKNLSLPSSTSSLSRASVTTGIKRAADSMAAANGTGQVVGWPPIRNYRMNSQAKPVKTEELKTGIHKSICNNNGAVKMRNSLFVKVNMDGIPIGRKVDLKAHNCYKALAETLEEMFLKPATGPNATRSSTLEHGEIIDTIASKLLDGSSGFVLTYEDKEGDWMLVGDVPWRMFLGSVKRLRIMRTSEATGIASDLHERNGRQMP